MTFEMLFAYEQASLKNYSPLPIAHCPLPLITWNIIFVQSPNEFLFDVRLPALRWDATPPVLRIVALQLPQPPGCCDG